MPPAASNSVAVAVDVDAAGGIYVAGWHWTVNSRSDAFVAKYDDQGQQVWTATYDGPPHLYDSFSHIAFDSAGNVLASGATSRGGSSGYDALLAKFDPNGRRLWIARDDKGAYNNPTDLALDSAGNAYLITGSGTPYLNTFVTLKFNPN